MRQGQGRRENMIWLAITIIICTRLFVFIIRNENKKQLQRIHKKFKEEWEMQNECKDPEK